MHDDGVLIEDTKLPQVNDLAGSGDCAVDLRLFRNVAGVQVQRNVVVASTRVGGLQ